MILNFIILISSIQILLYLISERINFKYGRISIFLAILAGHFFAFPRYFYPEPDPNGVNCGMPILGITLAFWVLGGGMAALVHLIYSLARIKTKVLRENNVLDGPDAGQN